MSPIATLSGLEARLSVPRLDRPLQAVLGRSVQPLL